jgi:hypothetical protein
MQRASTIHSGIMKISQAALDNHKYPQALDSSSAHDVHLHCMVNCKEHSFCVVQGQNMMLAQCFLFLDAQMRSP